MTTDSKAAAMLKRVLDAVNDGGVPTHLYREARALLAEVEADVPIIQEQPERAGAPLRYVVLKGSPYKTHLLPADTMTALCGKTPGQKSRGSSHRDRTGWWVYAKAPYALCAGCVGHQVASKLALPDQGLTP